MSALESSITLDEVFVVATAKRVPLAPELAGYLTLEVADGARDAEGDVDACAVYISEEGTVALVRPKKGMGDAETSIRILLGRLLEVSGSATPALSAVAKRKPGGGLSALIQELESALIPVNRAAGRRALARLAREVKRITMGVGRNALPPANRATGDRPSPPPSRSSSPPSLRPSQPAAPPPSTPNSVESLIGSFDVSPVGESQMSRDLRAIAGLDPTPAPPDALAECTKNPEPHGTERQDADAAEALVALADATNKLRPRVEPPVSGRREKVVASPTRTMATRRDRSGRTAARRPRARRASLALVVLGLIVLGLLVAWRIYPSFFAGKKTSVALAPTSELVPLAPATRCKTALIITDVPANAEILLRMGQSPVDVEHMAMGVRLEFVATAEGYLPKRALVAGEWNKGPDGKPRIDVPIELVPSKAKPGAVDPWPAAEPGTEIGRAGSPGTVHVVSNVRGAEVWFLAGLGPEARIEHLGCDDDIEVLIAGPPTLRKRLRVNERDIARASTDSLGNKVVTISGK